jgi:murein L,D-transpeptidase YafK
MRLFLRVISLVTIGQIAIGLSNLSQAETTLSSDPVAVRPLPGLVPDNLVVMGDGTAFSEYALIADKSKRTLTLWHYEPQEGGPRKLKLVDAYPMDIGKAGGDKVANGDHKTPEGIYFPQEMLDGSKINFDLYGVRIFTLNYPNFFDRRAKKTGYGIWLHAVPDTQSLLRGSRGCVVVRNEIVTKLTPYINLKKTPVIIVDEVKYVSEKEIKARQEKINQWIANWRAAWQTKDIEKYISFYDNDFRALGMSRNHWKRFKDSLNQRYSEISVKISSPVFFGRNNEAILNFMQSYDSSGLKDYGRKTLHLRMDAQGEYKILGEEWAPEAGGLLAHKPEEAAKANAEKAKN